MRKYEKILITSLLFLFALAVPVFGREMTVSELGEEALLQKPGINYIYIIGEYAFTSQHKITTQDVMLASRSINPIDNVGKTNEDEIYNEMAIYTIDGDVDSDTFEVKGWTVGNNIVGTSQLKDKFNISYIDYIWVKQNINTDKLIEEAEKDIQKNNLYSEKFDLDNKEIVFSIYDLNKKCSEIENTGILEAIVSIVNGNDNVLSLNVSNGKETIEFNKDNVSGGTASDSEVAKQFENLIAKLTGKSFEQVTLGDLIKLQDEITLTIKLDTQKAHSQNNKNEESYTVKFSYNKQADVVKEFSETEIQNLKQSNNYNIEDTYSIDGENGLYNVTGFVKQQNEVKGFGENKDGFYFAYTIKLNEDIDLSKVKVKVPKIPNPASDDDYNIVDGSEFEESTKCLTVLMEVEEKEPIKERDIIIDVDGVPSVIRINFSNLKLRKYTEFEIKDGSNETKLQSEYGWTKPSDEYKTEITVDSDKKDTVKISGVIPPHSGNFDGDKTPFSGEAKTGYYIALTISTKEKITENAKVRIMNGYKDDKESVAVYSDFDDENNLYILKHLHLEDTDRKFEIEVDLDGAETDYEAQVITVDWKDLLLQEKSLGNVNYSIITETDLDENSQEKQDLKDYGYSYNSASEVSFSAEKKLAGTVKQQTLADASGFTEKTGYFVPVKIELPENAVINEWTLTLHDESGKDKAYIPTQQEYEQGWVLVLFKLNENNTSIKYSIDFDGPYDAENNVGNKYVPYEYEIKYDGLNFAKAYIANNQSDLEKYLGMQEVQDIEIGSSFSVDKTMNINRKIYINGNNHTITADNSSVFTINASNVTIDNLALSTNETENEGIVIEGGAKLTASALDVTNCKTAGFTIKANGTLIGNDLVCENEKYYNPLVRADKNNVTVTLNGNPAEAVTVEEVLELTYNDETDKSTIEINQIKQVKPNYNYKHYYLDSKVANRWIRITYVGNRSITNFPKIYKLYYDREKDGDKVPEPGPDVSYLTKYSDTNANYTLAKWLGDGDKAYETGKLPVPTRETSYTAELLATYKDHTTEVTDYDKLVEAINNDSIKNIIVTKEIILPEKLVINKPNKLITGSRSGSREIIGTLKGQIEITAEKILFDEINIVGANVEEGNRYVVNVKTKGFRSDESTYRAGDGDFDSLLYFDVEDPSSTLFFNKFYGTGKVLNMIDFAKTVDGHKGSGQEMVTGTVLTGNEFYDENNAVTLINAHDIENGTTLNIRQTELQLKNPNTILLKIDAKPADSNVGIYISSLWTSRGDCKEAKIEVDTTTQKDASGITIEKVITKPTTLVVTYTTEDRTNDVQGDLN